MKSVIIYSLRSLALRSGSILLAEENKGSEASHGIRGSRFQALPLGPGAQPILPDGSSFPSFSSLKMSGFPVAASGRRGSVILIVLVTIMFAAVALTLFIEKAGNDLLVDAREADSIRLRSEAYSALETTVGVLEDFRVVAGGLHSPAEGWGNPLEFAHYEPAAGRTVDVQFVDESAKISLPKAQPTAFLELFKAWGMLPGDAQKLTDALTLWMKKDAPPGSAGAPRLEDYDRGALPSIPPGRSLHSFNELASIEYARNVFYDENGEPNELWHRFVETFSLYSYEKSNINGGNPATLTGLGVTDAAEKKRLRDFVTGTGSFQRKGPGFFKNTADVATLLGANSPAVAGLSTDIAALRVIVTVHEGRSRFTLSTVIAPTGGATLPPKTPDATPAKGAAPGQPKPAAPEGTPPPSATPKSRVSKGNADAKSLNYPFTILEIRENDEHSSVAAASAI